MAAVEFQISRSNTDSVENAFDEKNVNDVLCLRGSNDESEYTYQVPSILYKSTDSFEYRISE